MVNLVYYSAVKVLITAPKKIIQEMTYKLMTRENEFIYVLLRRKVPTGAYVH